VGQGSVEPDPAGLRLVELNAAGVR
jgi:hypothetical protein